MLLDMAAANKGSGKDEAYDEKKPDEDDDDEKKSTLRAKELLPLMTPLSTLKRNPFVCHLF